MLGASLSADSFIWLIGSLCQINRIPFDPQLILQRFPAPHTLKFKRKVALCQSVRLRVQSVS